MRLPEEYKCKMMNLLGSEYDAYEASLSEPLNHCLRVNTLKISVEDFLEISPFELEQVPWCDNAFYYDAEKFSPSKHPYYYAGLYYLQEASATLPAATLPVEEGDIILDMCAAPGGKTTELAARLKGTGLIVSNDVSASRLKALQKNVEAFGIENAVITCETPDRLAEHFGGYFDKILIDAPCSGEGMFRKSTSMVTAWEQNGNEKFAAIQRSIIKEAVKLLRPGGMLLYSTCTFDLREDEEQVQYILSLNDNLELKPIKMHEGFVPGYNGMERSVHLFPHKVHGEGHYVALLGNKADTDISEDTHNTSPNSSAAGKAYNKSLAFPDSINEFMKFVNWDTDRINRITLNNNKLFLMPEFIPDTKGLRTMRTGVYLGEVKKNRFEPSQSFAMILNDKTYLNCLNLSPEGSAVFRYLRGETLDLDYISSDEILSFNGTSDSSELKDGLVLIMVSGFPLGFAKNRNGQLKNKYLPGWRMMS